MHIHAYHKDEYLVIYTEMISVYLLFMLRLQNVNELKRKKTSRMVLLEADEFNSSKYKNLHEISKSFDESFILQYGSPFLLTIWI